MRPIDGDKLLEQANKDGAYGYVSAYEIANAPTIEPYGTWIPCSERLPEEKINPITQDYYEYQVTAVFGNEKCIRCYKFGNGHWWHGGIILDERVLAWMPSLEPYRQEKK